MAAGVRHCSTSGDGVGAAKAQAGASRRMEGNYNPKEVEEGWYSWWRGKGYFAPHAVEEGRSGEQETFSMVIPPPNVTGALHMGHALTNSLQDALCRWKRMTGARVVWVPGTDHAGIATQTVVEKRLMKERGLTRQELGREDFVKEAFRWKNDYRDRIVSQLQRMGSSLDWSRERFTMDEDYSKAVVEAFCRLHEKGLLYRDNRIVNWCCALQSTISDLEVEHVELSGMTKRSVPGYERMVQFGEMIHFSYPVVGSNERITVATTRIETMLGDVAVAVHPEDPRYQHLHGAHVEHPFSGKLLPIVTDAELVDMELGTGAVKVTPAHDPNDFLCGQRNGLPVENLLLEDGSLGPAAGQFAGLKRYDARYRVIEELEKKGLIVEKKSHPMSLGICSRTGDVVEPMVKPQWWMDCKQLAGSTREVIENGDLRLIPKQPHTAVWNSFLSKIQPWCLSRQLWWGHRVPAYRVTVIDDDKEMELGWVVARSEEEAWDAAREKYGEKAHSMKVKQDEDVLDTWFSSSIFPMAVHGWPNETKDFADFYPCSMLETGMDILFFWVMKMVMVCRELTGGALPFSEVFLHGIVRDSHGRKMSKSLGNVIDPIDVIEGITLPELHRKLREGNLSTSEVEKATKGQKKDYPSGIKECGTDALRFALCNYSLKGTHETINLDINVVLSHRHFCNKIWNATRFALSHLSDSPSEEGESSWSGYSPSPASRMTGHESAMDQWLYHRLFVTTEAAWKAWERYDFTECTAVVQRFWMEDLCSTYMESIKSELYEYQQRADSLTDGEKERKAAIQGTLYNAFDIGLRLLHPFMPFITEDLWQRLPRRTVDKESIMIAPYPLPQQEWRNEELDRAAGVAWRVVDEVRTMRGLYKIPHRVKPLLQLVTSSTSERESIQRFSSAITAMTKSSDCRVLCVAHDHSGSSPTATAVVTDSLKALMALEGVDIAAELQRLKATIDKATSQLDALVLSMEKPQYEKAAPAKKENDAKKVSTLRAVIEEHKKAAEGLTQ